MSFVELLRKPTFSASPLGLLDKLKWRELFGAEANQTYLQPFRLYGNFVYIFHSSWHRRSMMELKDWLIVGATFLSPILAVQAQKFVERVRERNNRKRWVFQTLMGTRAARLSADHVKALNMIDLVFYGSKIRRTGTEKAVLDAWKEYLDHLNTPVNEKDQALWNDKSEDLFVGLLFAISRDVGFTFDRVQLKRGGYAPKGHWDFEMENSAARKGWLEVVEGKRPLKMEITNIPGASTASVPPKPIVEPVIRPKLES